MSEFIDQKSWTGLFTFLFSILCICKCRLKILFGKIARFSYIFNCLLFRCCCKPFSLHSFLRILLNFYFVVFADPYFIRTCFCVNHGKLYIPLIQVINTNTGYCNNDVILIEQQQGKFEISLWKTFNCLKFVNGRWEVVLFSSTLSLYNSTFNSYLSSDYM